jgi:hypothetical protein
VADVLSARRWRREWSALPPPPIPQGIPPLVFICGCAAVLVSMPISINEMVSNLSFAEARLKGMSLAGKVNQLRQSRSPDKIQQLQTDVIVELYDAVKQLQEAVWPMLLVIPDTGAARDAAAAAAKSTPNPNTALTPPKFSR